MIAELGLPVCVLEDQHQFILQHEVLRKGGDSGMIVAFLNKAKGRYPAMTSCRMDKGYYSSSNRQELDRLLDLNVMPKKGGHTQKDRQREQVPDFAACRTGFLGTRSGRHSRLNRRLEKLQRGWPTTKPCRSLQLLLLPLQDEEPLTDA